MIISKRGRIFCIIIYDFVIIKKGKIVGAKAPRSFILMITKHVSFNICTLSPRFQVNSKWICVYTEFELASRKDWRSLMENRGDSRGAMAWRRKEMKNRIDFLSCLYSMYFCFFCYSLFCYLKYHVKESQSTLIVVLGIPALP